MQQKLVRKIKKSVQNCTNLDFLNPKCAQNLTSRIVLRKIAPVPCLLFVHTKLDCQKAKIEASGGLLKIEKNCNFSRKRSKLKLVVYPCYMLSEQKRPKKIPPPPPKKKKPPPPQKKEKQAEKLKSRSSKR